MNLFKFLNPTAIGQLEQGELITGYDSATWIERYRDSGEFTITADPASNLRALLPNGTFISHVDTQEVMIVETANIKIQEGQGTTTLEIVGRSYETFLESRVVGGNKTFPTSGPLVEFTIVTETAAHQAEYLLNAHIRAAEVLDPEDELPFVSVYSSVPAHPFVEARSIPRGPLYEKFLELLALEDLGIKTIRPGVWSPLGGASPNTIFLVHEGVDLSDTVIFSSSIGEIRDAEYLWSNKKFRNACLVTGRWLETMVRIPGFSGITRRIMNVDASDLDSAFTVEPTGTDRDTVLANMSTRGVQALIAQLEITMAQVELQPNLVAHKYRTDYNVGDIITVIGDYDESSKMRITEYVEIDDEKGSSGYPTLARY